MSSRIELSYRKVCENCKGSKRVPKMALERIANDTRGFTERETKSCSDCSGLGHTIETMRFDVFWQNQFWTEDHKYTIWNQLNPIVIKKMSDDKTGQSENVSESLHPISLEVIGEVDCPNSQCMDGDVEVEISELESRWIKCEDCNGNKTIEEVTHTTFFGSMKERDSEIVGKFKDEALRDVQRVLDYINERPYSSVDRITEDIKDAYKNIEEY